MEIFDELGFVEYFCIRVKQQNGGLGYGPAASITIRICEFSNFPVKKKVGNATGQIGPEPRVECTLLHKTGICSVYEPFSVYWSLNVNSVLQKLKPHLSFALQVIRSVRHSEERFEHGPGRHTVRI
jgi:hypothetical protein